MEGLKNYRDRIKSIEKLVDKMESGQLSIHELVELETLTRELHERSIILKYKAFEEAGSQRNDSEAENEAKVVMPDVMDTAVSITEFEEEVEEPFVEPEPEMKEAPVLDFSMFDTEEDEEEEEMEILPVIEEKPIAVESIPEPEHIPEPKAELPVDEPTVVVREKGSSFLDRLSIADNSISSQLAGRKIDTLSGAFGINERLLYINELFDGSGEAFSDAIKALDTQASLDAASNKVEELAFQNSWNPEEEVVMEFLAIIKRRYA